MRTIRTRYDKNTTRTTQVCSTCHYIYETMLDATPSVLEETVILGGSDNGNQPFIKLLDKNLIKDPDGVGVKTVNLYVCPRCLSIQLDNEEIYE